MWQITLGQLSFALYVLAKFSMNNLKCKYAIYLVRVDIIHRILYLIRILVSYCAILHIQ